MEERRKIWADLVAQPGWSLLKQMTEQRLVSIPRVTGVDSKEQFFFESAKIAGKLELLREPEASISTIDLKK